MFAQKVLATFVTALMQHVKEKRIYEPDSMRPIKMLTKDLKNCPADLAMQTTTQQEIDFSWCMIQSVIT